MIVLNIRYNGKGGERMRISAVFSLEQNSIDKDKNRIFISILKNILESYDVNVYKKFFESGPVRKSYCFALYMKDAEFTRDKIIIPYKKIVLKLSTADLEDAIHIYNAFLQNIRRTFKIRENELKLDKISIEREKKIYDDNVIFISLSPILIREHEGDNKKTWYHTLNDEKGRMLFLNNLKIQLLEEFGRDRILDIEEVKVNVLSNKNVKVKNYSIEVAGNLCTFEMHAKSYILEHVYKAGIGSQKSTGFGMLDLL
ncbi:MAG TPA: CRISPR-associated endoribonuclease Cas6 [Clostridiales bacterium]|jgi:CRISPR-associated endoribonuclease Cas6|nr:CRISPR-associated endoribonuclease Cas6 [Clostridiales bacterium]